MKIVCLNSGGLDTLAMMILLKEQGHELYSFHVNLSMPNSDQAEFTAAKLASRYCVSHGAQKILPGFPLKANLKGFNSYPNQTIIVFGLASAQAMSLEIYRVAAAIRQGLFNCEHPGREGAENWINRFMASQTVQTAPLFEFPMWETSDEDALNLVKEKDPEMLAVAWSCNYYPPCGTCPKCKLRKEHGI